MELHRLVLEYCLLCRLVVGTCAIVSIAVVVEVTRVLTIMVLGKEAACAHTCAPATSCQMPIAMVAARTMTARQ